MINNNIRNITIKIKSRATKQVQIISRSLSEKLIHFKSMTNI